MPVGSLPSPLPHLATLSLLPLHMLRELVSNVLLLQFTVTDVVTCNTIHICHKNAREDRFPIGQQKKKNTAGWHLHSHFTQLSGLRSLLCLKCLLVENTIIQTPENNEIDSIPGAAQRRGDRRESVLLRFSIRLCSQFCQRRERTNCIELHAQLHCTNYGVGVDPKIKSCKVC